MHGPTASDAGTPRSIVPASPPPPPLPGQFGTRADPGTAPRSLTRRETRSNNAHPPSHAMPSPTAVRSNRGQQQTRPSPIAHRRPSLRTPARTKPADTRLRLCAPRFGCTPMYLAHPRNRTHTALHALCTAHTHSDGGHGTAAGRDAARVERRACEGWTCLGSPARVREENIRVDFVDFIGFCEGRPENRMSEPSRTSHGLATSRPSSPAHPQPATHTRVREENIRVDFVDFIGIREDRAEITAPPPSFVSPGLVTSRPSFPVHPQPAAHTWFAQNAIDPPLCNALTAPSEHDNALSCTSERVLTKPQPQNRIPEPSLAFPGLVTSASSTAAHPQPAAHTISSHSGKTLEKISRRDDVPGRPGRSASFPSDGEVLTLVLKASKRRLSTLAAPHHGTGTPDNHGRARSIIDPGMSIVRSQTPTLWTLRGHLLGRPNPAPRSTVRAA
ncbi:hypothetical protein VTO73DRAFT_5436 [Trametes versicolor]